MDTTLANAIQYYDHAADCGIPVSNAKLNYTSTLEGSILTLICENDTSTDGDILRLSVICHSSGSWIPDPAQFTCSSSSFTTVPPGTEILINSSPHSSGSYSKYLSHYLYSVALLSRAYMLIIVRYCLGGFYVQN